MPPDVLISAFYRNGDARYRVCPHTSSRMAGPYTCLPGQINPAKNGVLKELSRFTPQLLFFYTVLCRPPELPSTPYLLSHGWSCTILARPIMGGHVRRTCVR